MATRLFVGNLPENTAEKDVHAAFSHFGEIKNLDLKTKPGTPESKKFAFVTLSASNNNVESCIRHFSIENFKGSKLYVTRARESFLERLQRERESEKERQKKIDEAAVAEEQQQEPHVKEEAVQLTISANAVIRKKISSESPTTCHPPSPVRQTSPTFKNRNKVNNISKVHVINTVEGRVLNTSPVADRKKNDSEKNRIESVHNKQAELIQKQNVSKVHSINAVDRHVLKSPAGVFSPVVDRKKNDSEKKRLESLQKKRAEFKQKQNIIKNSLTGVDKIRNKKVIFSHDHEEEPIQNGVTPSKSPAKTKTLFDEDDDSDPEVNFEIKKQYEGKMGQKVLDLQSRYKSDKRFVLDERFVEEDQTEAAGDDEIELQQADEKNKQLDILQDVLGVTLKRKLPDDDKDKKTKPKLGMLRFDPSHPEHARFLAPIEDAQPQSKKSKKKNKEKAEVTVEEKPKLEEKRPEVSKEQFYKVSDTLKEAIAQPTHFSLRSLFGSGDNVEEESKEESTNYIPLESTKKPKVKNPLDPGEKNPFVYDSSDSETEDVEKNKATLQTAAAENKAVWKESLFFTEGDHRLKDGLAFFNSNTETDAQKERRELKSIMKKRIYNKERQNQMFRKKIGGRKKTMKKSFQKRN